MAAPPEQKVPDYNTKPITLLKNPVVNAISLVNKGANKKRFFLFKSEDSPVDHAGFHILENGDVEEDPHGLNKVLPLIKAGPTDDEWSVVYCVVAVPGEVDHQKDVWTEEVIRDAAHSYLKQSRLINYMHQDFNSVGELVESAIAPADMHVGGETIAKGSWFIAIEPNEHMKKMIKTGDITGVSVQGSSAREQVDDMDKYLSELIVKGNEGAYSREVPGRQTTQTDEIELHENKDDMEIPKNAEGAGVVALQNKLGIPESGKYDKHTDRAVREWMAQKGVPGKPTIATLKLILKEDEATSESGQPTNPQEPAMAQAQKQPEAAQEAAQEGANEDGQEVSKEAVELWKKKGTIYHYKGDKSKTPLWIKDVDLKKDALTVEFPPSKDGEPEVATVYKEELYPCENPDHHHETLAKDHPNYPSSYGGPYNPTDNVGDTTRNWARAGTGQGAYDSYGSHPESRGTQPQDVNVNSSADTLKAVILRALSNGNEILATHLRNNYGITGSDSLYGQELSQDTLWGIVARYVLGREENPPSPSMMMQQVAHRQDRSMYPEGSGFSMQKGRDLEKVALFDSHTPVSQVVGKNGQPIGVGAIVKVGSEVSVVSSINVNENKISVEALPKTGDNKTKEVDAKKAELLLGDPAACAAQNASMSKAVKGRAGGSMGGHDPRKHGKIRFIVRSFGKWAKGKHSVCVRRMRREHPEVFKGNENAGCAWLKDQWMGTTKWRTGRKKGKIGKMRAGESTFAEAYNQDTVSKVMNDEQINSLFKVICSDLGLDVDEMEKMISGPEDLEKNLDGIFGPVGQNDDPEDYSTEDLGLAKAIIDVMNEDLDNVDKLLVVEELMKEKGCGCEPGKACPMHSGSVQKSNNEEFMKGMRALQLGLASALEPENLEKRDSYLEEVMVDFQEWLDEFTSEGNHFEFVAAPSGGKLEKGWLPSGTSQGDLKDGDFAWLSDAYKSGDASKTAGRKLPYKIHGKVNDRGWKAAWAALHGSRGGVDLSGGPDKEEVKRKLLRDKPKSVEVADTMEKMESLKGATVQDADGRKWIVMSHDGDKLGVVSGKNRATIPADSVKVVKQPMGKADGGNLVGATVRDAEGREWKVKTHEGGMLTVVDGDEEVAVEVSDVEVVRPSGGDKDMDKGGPDMEYGHDYGEEGQEMPSDAKKKKRRDRLAAMRSAAEAGPYMDKGGYPDMAEKKKKMRLGYGMPEEGGPYMDKAGDEAEEQRREVPNPVKDEMGDENRSRLARLLEMARKRKKDKEAAEGSAPEAGGRGPEVEKAGYEEVCKSCGMHKGMCKCGGMAKSADTLTAERIERMREVREFLESALRVGDDAEGAVGDTDSEYEGPNASQYDEEDTTEVENNTEVEKDVDASNTEDMEENMSDTQENEFTMDQVVEAVNGLGHEVDSILDRLDDLGTLSSKLDDIGNIAKSLDSGDRVGELEQVVEKLTEALGAVVDTVESVDELNKRLTALEGRPGQSTAAPVDVVDREPVAKSAPDTNVLFQRNGSSIF